LDVVLKINPVFFKYNAKSGHDVDKEYMGVIAQELQVFAPYIVGTFELDGVEYLNVDNSAMTYMLINAPKEQQQIIEQQQQQIDLLQQQIDELRSILQE